MSENIENITIEEHDPNVVYATIVKEDDGYHLVDHDGTMSAVCPLTKDERSICLPKNASNRQWMSVVALAKHFETTDEPYPLYFKGTRKIGSTGSRTTALPNAKLISYLSEEDQAEYKAIIDRAIAARDAEREANKKKPMTELEKAQARLEKAKAALAKLQAEAAE